MRGSIVHTLFNHCIDAIADGYAEDTLIANSIFANCMNSAILNFGIGGNSVLYTTQIVNSIFYNNTLDIDLTRGGIAVRGCCFSSHPKIALGNSSGVVTDDRSMIGEGCFIADPQFVDAANGDFRLKSTSPCWNMGMANSFVIGNVGHIGPQGMAFRGQPSRSAVYANVKQIVR
jgi:hypothetical protein